MFSKTLLAFAALAASVRASCIHGTSYMKRQEGAVEVSPFGYHGETGPLAWAGLDASFETCRTGTTQSPINITPDIPFLQEVPQITINPVAAAEFENLGSTVEVIVNGSTTVLGATFELKQFHFHTPSEHHIGNEYFPVEMHMVHEGANGALAVIAVMFQLSADSTTQLLSAVTQNLEQIRQPGTKTTTGPLDFAPLIQHLQTTQLFQYTGSLTTPPCAEGLTFFVTSQPLPIDVTTFNALKSVVQFNARFTQNDLGRTNLLDVATQLAVAGGGGVAPPPAGGAAANNASNVDVTVLLQQLVAQNKALKIETVTTTVAHVALADDNGAAVPPQAGGNAPEAPGAGAESPAPSSAAPSPAAGGSAAHTPAAHAPAQTPAQDVVHARVSRSRIARRSTPGKRRL